MASLIFGKVFATMFTGSMYGSGAPVFAVMTYVIANMQPDRDRVEFVRLNPQVLADTIGEKKETIQRAIDFLCGKDDGSNHKEELGKRLVLEGPYLYRVVNGRYYRELKDEEDRLAKDAVRAANYRARHPERVKRGRKPKTAELPAHSGLVDRLEQSHGTAAAEALMDHMADEHAANLAELNGEQSGPLPVEQPVRIRNFTPKP